MLPCDGPSVCFECFDIGIGQFYLTPILHTGPVSDEGVVVATVSIASVHRHPDQLILGRHLGGALMVTGLAGDQGLLHVGGHVQSEGEGEVGVDLLLHHCHL